MTEREINAHCDILRSALVNEIGEDAQMPAIIIASAMELLRGFLTDVNCLSEALAMLAVKKS